MANLNMRQYLKLTHESHVFELPAEMKFEVCDPHSFHITASVK